MAVRHVSTNIQVILQNQDNFLGALFNMDGAKARQQLEEMKDKGDKFVGSDSCQHFDPLHGCMCERFEHVDQFSKN